MEAKVVARLAKESRRGEMLLLVHAGGRYEFLSELTGRSVLTWFSSDGRWSAAVCPEGMASMGKASSPFGALHAAIEIDRTIRRSIAAPTPVRDRKCYDLGNRGPR